MLCPRIHYDSLVWLITMTHPHVGVVLCPLAQEGRALQQCSLESAATLLLFFFLFYKKMLTCAIPMTFYNTHQRETNHIC